MINFLPFFKRHARFKADVSVNAGGGYKVVFYLRKFKLRIFSSPFDWLGLYTSSDINACFEEGFANLFREYEEAFSAVNKRWVRDRQSGMRPMYDFSSGKSLECGYEHFITQKRGRLEDLKRHIKASEHVCFVSCRQDNYVGFKKFLKQIQIFHHAKYTLINVRHGLNCKGMKKVELEWGKELHLMECLFSGTHRKGKACERIWLGNTKLWHKIMRSLGLEKRS